MEQFGNNASTTLNGSILSGATSLVVTSAANFPTTGNFRIIVDSGVNLEYMLVTAVSGTTFTVTRGQEGTTAVAHSSLVQVVHVVTAGSVAMVRGDWQTVLDLDFTAQTTQTLSPDTTYSIGGLTFTKRNSANETANTVLTNGTGISFTPSTAGDFINSTRSFPYLFLPFSQLPMPNLDWSSGIRVWAYISASNAAANFDNSILAVGGDSNSDWYYATFRGFNASQGLWLRRTINASTTTSGVFGVTLSNSAFQVMGLTVDSLWGATMHGNLTTGTGSPWPTYVRPMNMITDGTGAQTDGFAGNSLTPGAMGLWFGAMRPTSGTAFVSTIARLRVDVRY